MAKPESGQNIDWKPYRWLTSLIGLVLLIVGQFHIASDIIPEKSPLKLGAWLNTEIHLSIPTIDNVLRGLPLLLIGAVLLFISLNGLKLLPSETERESSKSVLPGFFRSGWPWLLVGFITFAFLLWQIRYRDYRTVMVIQWLLVLLLFAVAAALWDHKRQVNLSPSLGRADFLWMIGLFTLGILIGTYRLQGLPDMLIGDEGSFFSTARDIALGEFSPPIFASGVYTFPVLSSIGQALIMKVFGVSLWGWRFSSVLSGTLAIFPVYLLGRDAFNRKMAIISCIALIISPYFLAFARIGYNNIQSLFITALALYWLYIGYQRSSVFYLFLAGCALGLGFYTYFAARMALFIAILFIGILFLAKKLKFRFFVLYMGVLLVGAFLVFGPYIVYGMQYDSQGMSFKVFESVFFNTFNGYQFYSEAELTSIRPFFTIGGNELFYNPKIYLELIARGFIRTVLFFQKPWMNSEHFIAFPLAGTIGVIFYLIGFGAIFKRIKEPRHLLMVLWFLVTIFGLSVLNTVPPRHTHMVSIIPVLALMTGMGIYILAGVFSSLWAKAIKFKVLLLGILTAIVTAGGIYDYFILMPDRYHPNADQVISWAGMYVKDESIDFVYANKNEIDIVRPYLISEFYPEVSYSAVSLDEFSQETDGLSNSGKLLVFYLPALAREIEPVLSQAWGTQTVLRDFYNPDGIPVISVGMNTPFVFERDRSFLSILSESYGRIPLLLLISIFFVLSAVTAFLPLSWIQRMPRWVKTFSTWFNAPVQPLYREEELLPVEEIQESIPPHKEVETGPPAWAEKVFPPIKEKGSRKFVVESKLARAKKGRDLYFHIHLPAIHIPWKHLPADLQPHLPDLQIPTPPLMLLVVILAIVGQLLISQQEFLAGAVFYLLSAAALIYWSRKNPKWKSALINQARIPPRAEIWIGLLLLAVIIFTRFYDLGYRVYGLEADETKWTVQSWLSAILRVDLGEFSSMHYQYLPVDFWVRSFFLRTFGLNFMSARIESAVFSVIAAIFLYLLIRRLTSSPPTALLGTALYSLSFIELNGSHQALHNTTLEPWIMAGFYFLITGVQEKKWWQFQVSGVILALGMLTYETFFPTVGVALIFVIVLAILQIIRKQANLKQWLQRIVLLLWPILLVYLVFTQPYLASRQNYHFGWLETYSQGGTNISGALLFILNNTADLLRTTFFGVVFPDSLLRWQGSFLNQVVLPFVVIGFIYNFLQIRKPYFMFILLWYMLNIITAPLLLGSVWPRVLYTSLPPLLIWGAMGLWIFLAALRSWLDRYKLKLALPVFLFLILGIFVNDYRIFSAGIDDPLDRVKRRELADLTSLSAKDASLLVFPYMPAQNETVELEKHVILFSIAGIHENGLNAGEDFQHVPYDRLMTFLWENRESPGLDLFFDKSIANSNEERTQFLEIVLACYPGTNLIYAGEYFNVYRMENRDLSLPVCYQSAAPTPVAPAEGAEIPSGQPVSFVWDSGEIKTTGFSLGLEQKTPGAYWIEAEDVFQTNGWYASSEFVTDFTGTGFLLDNWESGEAQYSFTVEEEGRYRVWIRSYKRTYNDQQNFITIDGQAFNFSGDESSLDAWKWESMGNFNLSAGETTIGLGRSYGQDDMFSVFIDTIFITPNLQDIPGLSSVWRPLFTIQKGDNLLSSYTLTELLPPGDYRWNVRVFDGERLLDLEGDPGNVMPFAYFTVLP